MSRLLMCLSLAAACLLARPAEACGPKKVETKINTPEVLARLAGEWILAPADPNAYRQRLTFHGAQAGEWLTNDAAHPTSITYYVEGSALLVQHYHEAEPGFYRMQTHKFDYTLDGDSLTLTRDGKTETWFRVPPPIDPTLLRCSIAIE